MAVRAWAATSAPEVSIYRVSGVLDDGATNGTATSFHCTNFSGVTETIRIVVRSAGGTLMANASFTVPHLTTKTASTKHVVIYDDAPLFTNPAAYNRARPPSRQPRSTSPVRP